MISWPKKRHNQLLKLLDANISLPQMNWKAVRQLWTYSCETSVTKLAVGPLTTLIRNQLTIGG